MKNFLFFTIFLFFLGPGVISEIGENQINAEDGSIAQNATTGSSTTVPTTTPDTTKASTVTTTEPSTVTTTEPSTVTTTVETTQPPSSTAAVSTTPVYPPADKGDLHINTWNTTCIVAKMGVKFTFLYTAKGGANTTIVLNMPNGTTFYEECSSCGSDLQTLCIPFYNDWMFNITFRKKDTTDFSVSELGLTYSMNSHYFPNISKETWGDSAVLHNLTDMSSKINSSYQCYNQKPLNFAKVRLQSIEFAKLQLEAFRNSNTSDFSDPIPCAADTEINNIVPIAVGAALGGLVIIVLIAYLIGRKRSRRGYESV